MATRSYISAADLKVAVNTTNSDALNIFFVDFVDVYVEGFATMPWEVDALSRNGGIVIQGGDRLSNSSLIHETGHALGLLHVHHGVSDVGDIECREVDEASSMETGDFIEDTAPTPANLLCSDPPPALDGDEEVPRVYVNTPYRNFMSYADASCTTHFTPHQAARMHCYIDLVYASSWDPAPTAGVVPLPPRITTDTHQGGVGLAWLPPLSGHRAAAGREGGGDGDREGAEHCWDCLADGAYVQYAARVASSAPRNKWLNPAQAIGPPDARPCKPSSRAYMCKDCYLDVAFKHPVVPATLTIWASHIASSSRDVFRNIHLYFDDGTKEALGPGSVDCDIPFTVRLFTTKRLTYVRIYVTRTYIDAIQVVSVPGSSLCQSCSPHRYWVSRVPPFAADDAVEQQVETTWFVDQWAEDGVAYSYSAQPVVDGIYGPVSPPVFHQRGGAMCGNGRLERLAGVMEECDDGNHGDGDGCDKQCRTEAHFICEGEPSQCRRYKNDDLCEDFERTTSEGDCGFYTPPGYIDQWATSASANPLYQSQECPTHYTTGPPLPGRECVPQMTLVDAWYPCGVGLEDLTDYWLKLGFQKPVVATSVIVHIAGMQIFGFEDEYPQLSVQLLDEDGEPQTPPSEPLSVTCLNSALYFNLTHDLSRPFFYSRYVLVRLSSPYVAISAVRLRSFASFDPVELLACGRHELYNPGLGRCMDYECERPVAEEPVVRNANVTCSGLLDGDTCTVQCIVGYRPSTPITLKNVEGVWVGSPVMCKPVDCGMPILDSHLAIAACSLGTTYGKECSFKCISPAKLQGTDNSLRCEEDGLFSLAQSFCEVLCDAPPVPTNALLQTHDCRSDGHGVGSSCKFRCKAGFMAMNKKGRPSRMYQHHCSDNSSWVGPVCKPVRCPPIEPVYHDLYNCTNGFSYKSQCTLHCGTNNTFPNTITCTKEGTWDRSFAPCEPQAVCPEPVPHPDVQLICPRGYSANSTCQASCRYGLSYQPALEGATYRQRGLLGNDYSIVCTAGGRWYPALDQITCQKSCWVPFINDDQCESVNNRAYCLWDGGACCPSTAPQGRVITFLQDCGQPCECRDPGALENIHRRNGSVRETNRPPV